MSSWLAADRSVFLGSRRGPLVVGLNVNNWGPQTVIDAAECVHRVRVESEDSHGAEFVRSLVAAGLSLNLLFSGPYDEGGVSAIDVEEWVATTLAFYEANAAPETAPVVEILNEPFGPWFWGTESRSTANRAAYRVLVQAAYEAFHARYGEKAPVVLAAYESSAPWWTPACSHFVDGIVVHAYGGTGSRAESALGDRSLVEEAHQKTSKPVYVTEIGWPTAVGEPPTGDSLQWSEAEQAQNIENFIAWARSKPYVAEVMIFCYRDFGTNTWYGIAKGDGTRKVAFGVLATEAAG